ncbi:MAG: hypothetical protein P4N41_21980 [Negativicutes bacterium]|nr:hypothetical protein [Negativicutes bacterium]
MQLKSSYKSNSTRHLYEYAEEIGVFGNTAEKLPEQNPAESAGSGSGRRSS